MRARIRFMLALAAMLAWSAAPDAQRPSTSEPVQLPVRRVVLYKSGVGFFEHLGNVTGSADIAIQFTSGQLDDALKSLTALDLDRGAVSAISYNSVAPIDQQLAALRPRSARIRTPRSCIAPCAAPAWTSAAGTAR